jgi:Na+-driven multidrug efflux pump
VKVSAIFLVGVSATVAIFAPTMISWFRDDPEVIKFGAMALRLQCLTFPLQSWIVMSNMMQQVLGRTASATFLAIARQGIFFIPCVLLLPLVFNELGIQMTQAVADNITVLCAIPLQIHVLRSLPKEDKLKTQ